MRLVHAKGSWRPFWNRGIYNQCYGVSTTRRLDDPTLVDRTLPLEDPLRPTVVLTLLWMVAPPSIIRLLTGHRNTRPLKSYRIAPAQGNPRSFSVEPRRGRNVVSHEELQD